MSYETIQEIAGEMARRHSAQNPMFMAMRDVRDRYNADVVVPVPETDDDMPLESLAPLLIADAVDHPALYAAQTPPNIFVPALQPGKLQGVRSTDYASKRRKALYYTWDRSWWEMVLGRFYRHLSAYYVSALEVIQDSETGEPRLVTRDPLSAYPEPRAPEDLVLPTNVGFIVGKSLDWLHRYYPETIDRFPQPAYGAPTSGNEGELWDIVRWVDEDRTVIGVLGPRDVYQHWTTEPTKWAYELERFPNLLERCPAVMPRRVTLDKMIAQLSNLTGHVDLMAKLMYLDIRASERSVFPDRYILSRTGQNPRLADSGGWLDGATGEINRILDADAVGELRGTPDPNNKITLDRLERNFRVSSGLIPQAGGETYGALRTGRGIDALMGAALDPRTTELHRLAERYLTAANELILTGYKVWTPNRSFSVYSPLDPGAEEFIPAQHVETGPNRKPFVDNRVHYPIPGMDDINATQVIGQMMGARLIAAYDARRMHPHVTDPEGTERRLMVEELEQFALTALGQRAATPPGIPPADLARMIALVRRGASIDEAIAQADKEAQARQAASPEAMGGPPGAPQMPGLANPGEGAELGAGNPNLQGPGDNLTRFRELVNALQATGGGNG